MLQNNLHILYKNFHLYQVTFGNFADLPVNVDKSHGKYHISRFHQATLVIFKIYH